VSHPSSPPNHPRMRHKSRPEPEIELTESIMRSGTDRVAPTKSNSRVTTASCSSVVASFRASPVTPRPMRAGVFGDRMRHRVLDRGHRHPGGHTHDHRIGPQVFADLRQECGDQVGLDGDDDDSRYGDSPPIGLRIALGTRPCEARIPRTTSTSSRSKSDSTAVPIEPAPNIATAGNVCTVPALPIAVGGRREDVLVVFGLFLSALGLGHVVPLLGVTGTPGRHRLSPDDTCAPGHGEGCRWYRPPCSSTRARNRSRSPDSTGPDSSLTISSRT